MNTTLRILAMVLMAAFMTLPALAQQEEAAAATPSVPVSVIESQIYTTQDAGADENVDDEWLNTIWTQVDDMVKEEEHKLQETITVAGVRGAEAEDSILDRLYYKGAKRYPSQDKLSKAIDTLRKALAAAPKGENAPMQKFFIAQCYEKLGRTADAKSFYGQVTQNHANTTWAKKARTELDRLTTQ